MLKVGRHVILGNLGVLNLKYMPYSLNFEFLASELKKNKTARVNISRDFTNFFQHVSVSYQLKGQTQILVCFRNKFYCFFTYPSINGLHFPKKIMF